MTLESEILKASQEIVKDGYDMSIGEILNLYRDQELVVEPEFQRYFRWDVTRKTRFIESLLLGIPIPPIFVFQRTDGVWELIDGLQRLSTIFEFVGVLKLVDGNIAPPFSLEGTKMLPSLNEKVWLSGEHGLSKPQQLQVKRARIRVEILTKESDPQSKYELFQRLNTGGASLTEQEVRNCIMVKINIDFYRWIRALSEDANFASSISLSENALQQQKNIELVLRFFVLLHQPYNGKVDVNEYLDNGMYYLALRDNGFNFEENKSLFKDVFSLIYNAHGGNSFKRFSNNSFSGQFLISAYEAIAYGVGYNIRSIKTLPNFEAQVSFVRERIQSMWSSDDFTGNIGAGVRGTTRLANLIPFSREFFKNE